MFFTPDAATLTPMDAAAAAPPAAAPAGPVIPTPGILPLSACVVKADRLNLVVQPEPDFSKEGLGAAPTAQIENSRGQIRSSARGTERRSELRALSFLARNGSTRSRSMTLAEICAIALLYVS
jgi:hypothetical protein